MTQELDQRLDPDDLQGELRDLLSLAVVGDHVRWVVTGEGAAELAEWLASATLQWRAWADDLARHLVTLGVAPDARVRSVAKDIPVHWVPEGWLRPDDAARLVVDRLGSLAGWARYRHSQALNPETVRLLDTVSSGLEAHAHDGHRIMRAFVARDVATTTRP
jgi:starvation-inducible DNA-binding protein